ncbi:hypothetical protein [Leptolyngbya sp. FACHB-711]|uniref:hypothetical protein n=1 Tax=unclassified Leptolyngbya TaxID=2650499 RepID=UPI001682A142|nr:hypothetical protein [Leptolyngbya sp. FACHB-711]MBD1850613.1 hypothetical protein [Cyanobacteria bacterium FACHB-502]MBD2023475.1 hypothetical protein [Leptolyngbya sp. FACHB-711]
MESGRLKRLHRRIWGDASPEVTGLLLSLLVPIYFGAWSLWFAFGHPFVIQDDARQHIVWFQQFVDPALFQQDWIARYFGTVAPAGYRFLYWIMAQGGIEPIAFAKVIPLLLALITTYYVYRTALIIFPVALQACLSSLILNQQLWLNDDLSSATPRAFVYPIFAAFLYFLLRQSLIPGLITIALQGLFFPQLVLVQLGILTLRLVRWENRRFRLSRDRRASLFWISGMIVGTLTLLPFLLKTSEFGGAITAAQMQSLPEYGLGGRSEYFGVSPIAFWLQGGSGLRIPVFPTIIWAGLGLPLLKRMRLPLVKSIAPEVNLLGQVLISSLVCFLLAHLLLLRLHFPSRYTYHTLRFILSIAAGIVLTVLMDTGWRWVQQRRQQRDWQLKLKVGIAVVTAAIVLIVPAIPALFFQFQGWVIGEETALYEYLRTQPKQTLVASLSPEANNLPAFAQRSTLTGREFALAHHPQYYQQIQARTIDLIRLQYLANLEEVKQLIQKHHIDFLLVDRNAFTPDYLMQDWLIHSSFQNIVQQAIDQMHQGNLSAIGQLRDHCGVVSTERSILLETKCIIAAYSPTHPPT